MECPIRPFPFQNRLLFRATYLQTKITLQSNFVTTADKSQHMQRPEHSDQKSLEVPQILTGLSTKHLKNKLQMFRERQLLTFRNNVSLQSTRFDPPQSQRKTHFT